MTSKQIGDYGETAAADYMERKGYTIIKRNYKLKGGEIDIIANDYNGKYIFAEVKTRKNANFGTAAEFVDKNKQARIKNTALAFLGREDVDMRFDVVEVYCNVYKNKISVSSINYIENAF